MASDDAETDLMFSQSVAIEEPVVEFNTSIVPQEAIDKAILKSDEVDGVLYAHLTVDHELFDVTSKATDVAYLQKVSTILRKSWKEMAPELDRRIFEIYEMRERNEWKGADSLYDAWLISSGKFRKWFCKPKFKHHFPDYKEFTGLYYYSEIEREEKADEGYGEESYTEESEAPKTKEVPITPAIFFEKD